MQQASRILVVTFRQQAPEYPKRVQIDWVRVDEVKLRAGRSDGVVFSSRSVPFKLYACTMRKKNEGPTTYLRRDWPLKSTVTDWLGCSGWWLFSLHLPLSPCSLALVIALSPSLAFWRAQMATRMTMMVRWKSLLGWQVSFSLSLSPTQAHTIRPSAYTLILIYTR